MAPEKLADHSVNDLRPVEQQEQENAAVAETAPVIPPLREDALPPRATVERVLFFHHIGCVLTDGKAVVGHGEHLKRLKQIGCSQPTAWRLMQLARLSENDIRAGRFTTIKDALMFVEAANVEWHYGEDRPTWGEAIKRTMETPRWLRASRT